MIPKIIWQTHESNYEDLPEIFLKTTATWKNLNPGWEYRYFNAKQREEYVKANDPELYIKYRVVAKCHQADIWRYLVLFNHGGAYADTDSVCVSPLDYIISRSGDDVETLTTDEYLHELVDSSKNYSIHNIRYINGKDYDPSIHKEVFYKTNNSNIVSSPKSSVLFETLNLLRKELYLKQNPDGTTEQSETIDLKNYITPTLYADGYSPWDCYNLALNKHADKISRELSNAAIHDDLYKDNFNNEMTINIYGKKMKYVEFIEQNNLKEYYINE